MRRHGIVVAATIGIMLTKTGVAQEFPPTSHIHPLTGHAPADVVPIARRHTLNSVATYPPIYQSAFASGSPELTSCADDCVQSCGEGCIAEEQSCAGSCLFGDAPLFSCLRNQKSCFSDDVTYSVGGKLRHRFMNEENRLRPGVPAGGASTDYRKRSRPEEERFGFTMLNCLANEL